MKVGHTYSLQVSSLSQENIELDGKTLGPVTLARSEAPTARIGEILSVFLYTDANARTLASCNTALVECDHCATLKVADISEVGAFLDWGMPKHLLLPFAEQRRPLEVGRYESVLVYLDNSGRLAASSRLDLHLSEQPTEFKHWQQVDLLIYQRTDLGYKAVINDCAIGLIYKDEIFQRIRVGERLPGYIKHIRPDGRVDLSLQPRSRDQHDDLTTRILAHLQAAGGVSSLNDKSSPELIYQEFNTSKKNFKKALGSLYRNKRIRIEADQIVLVHQESD